MNELRSKGFAVALFTPGELQGTATDVVETNMITEGWTTIQSYKDPNLEDFDWENTMENYPTGELL